MDKDAKIYVAGHRGLVGSAILRHLQRVGYSRLITRFSCRNSNKKTRW
ncbi:MAG: NAD-dependent epimerase/dehydratase family protein [Desulfamplus sp.]|nr:NAD-dependent epimerase/dehydratase family protein [Desulfamplus sp.]